MELKVKVLVKDLRSLMQLISEPCRLSRASTAVEVKGRVSSISALELMHETRRGCVRRL